MSILRCGGSISQALRASYRPRSILSIASPSALTWTSRRGFHAAPTLWAIKSQVLKDVGEGIMEVQIIQWYVEEGAHIEEWKPLCQYQSDKAVDDITSRYEGIVRKLHFQADDTVPTGKALCDIEVEDGKYPDDGPKPEPKAEPAQSSPAPVPASSPSAPAETPITQPQTAPEAVTEIQETAKSRHAAIATPAVRGLLKAHNINILDVPGTGKDGRVLKEDVHRYVSMRDTATTGQPAITPEKKQTETAVNLTPIQSQMFKTMTRSTSIPHFLYADELKIDAITALRKKLAEDRKDPKRITFLPFVIKAVSLALNEYPLLNSKIDLTNPDKPKLIMRPMHNIGVAMDTPQGLIVPNIKDVASRSILDIAAEISRLSALGRDGKLTPADLNGGTITVSNIGNIGGTYVGPVLVPTEVAILGIGKSRTVPVFDDAGQVTKADLVNFSWSADHRVVDGATMARMATRIQEYIETPEIMLLSLK